MLRKVVFYISYFSLLVLFFSKTFATDAESEKAYHEGISEFSKGSYKDAAKKFAAAELFADDYKLKSNALKKKVEAYRKADMKFHEFEALKRLTEDFPDQIDFKSAIDREYEIGNSFYEGYRETPFGWLPWLKDEDKSLEVYEAIMKQSPFAKFVPEMMLKMGTRYVTTRKVDKAIEIYKKMILQYKSSELTKFAYLDLANIYLQQAKSGDGDGSKARDARTMFKEFIEKYPDAKEIPWAKNAIKKTYEIEAARLLGIAKYYNSIENSNAAKKYIREILVNYPETKSVNKAYALLDEIEMPLYPKTLEPEKEEISKYTNATFPQEEDRLLVIPQNSGRKWISPITDMGISEDNLEKDRFKDKL